VAVATHFCFCLQVPLLVATPMVAMAASVLIAGRL
jgi:hypothetical protein